MHFDRYYILYFLLTVCCALETIFAHRQTKDKQDGGIILNTCCYEIWWNVFGHCVVYSWPIYGFWLSLWYLQTLLTDWNIWYYMYTMKGLLNWYWGINCLSQYIIFTRTLVQYNILLGTIFLNISAIILYYKLEITHIDDGKIYN